MTTTVLAYDPPNLDSRWGQLEPPPASETRQVDRVPDAWRLAEIIRP